MINLSEKGLTPEIIENQKIYEQYFDPDFPTKLVEFILGPIADTYFRPRFVGFDDLPERNNPDHPLIYASNHSGMAFPWDAIIFASSFFRKNNCEFSKSVRVLTAPMLSYSKLMNPYLVPDFWKRCGGIDATSLNFETMMYYRESNLLIYPEGVPGIGKGFHKKYQLQRFSTSFIRISLKYRTDIIPFSTVNGEYVNPYNLKSELLNRLSQKIGIPFIPIGAMTFLLLFQPWLFYFGFPANFTYVMGKKIKPYEMINKPPGEITEDDIQWVTLEVKSQMQAELTEAVGKYGQRPYQFKSFIQSCKKSPRKFPFFIPSFWPILFIAFERMYQRRRVKPIKTDFRSGIRALFKNPITIAFYLPVVGWIPILFRGLRGMKKAK